MSRFRVGVVWPIVVVTLFVLLFFAGLQALIMPPPIISKDAVSLKTSSGVSKAHERDYVWFVVDSGEFKGRATIFRVGAFTHDSKGNFCVDLIGPSDDEPIRADVPGVLDLIQNLTATIVRPGDPDFPAAEQSFLTRKREAHSKVPSS